MCSGDEESVSVGEDYYSDSDGGLGESDGNSYDDSNETKVVLPEKRYSILSEEDIHRRQQEDITEVACVLTLSRSAATTLLCNYNWDVINVQDTWFADEEGVRLKVGLLEKQVFYAKSEANKLCCQICFEFYPHSLMVAASCGHPFCGACWTGYVSSSINDGSGCLTLRCPFPRCNAAVGEDMIRILASEDDKAKYSHYLLRSYIEGSNKTKWCPAPGCEYVVDYVIGSDNFDVTCRCTHYFCWNCTEEAHRPLDCGTVGKWILKNSAESENTNWILANSKPCPKCKRPIEKNQGCMHMTCYSPCRFQFCWLCLGEWSRHGERSGGFYSCNGYENFKKQGEYEESERRRKMAKISLEKYTHYYERWAANHLSRQKALQNLQDMKDVQVHKLTARYSQPHSQLAFIIDAWLQIVECRRILKWTYAFGYYFSEEEQDKKQFFEYLQGEAEHGLERLHKCAEKELEPFIASEEDRMSPLPSLEAFHEFRTKLVGLTKVTNVFFENLMRALEDGFTDFDGCSKTVSSKNLVGESQGAHSWSDASHWSCTHCTFANPSDAVLCEICHNKRGVHEQG